MIPKFDKNRATPMNGFQLLNFQVIEQSSVRARRLRGVAFRLPFGSPGNG